jgi:hypothetical protein
MRRFVVAVVFVLVIFMSLTTLGVFGQAFSDSVRHSIRDSASRLVTVLITGEDALVRAAQRAMSKGTQIGSGDSGGRREADARPSGENLN